MNIDREGRRGEISAMQRSHLLNDDDKASSSQFDDMKGESS